MKKPTTISKESVSEYREFVQLRLRKRVLEAIEVVLEEEVDQALPDWGNRQAWSPASTSKDGSQHVESPCLIPTAFLPIAAESLALAARWQEARPSRPC